jgi:hypothetical protein
LRTSPATPTTRYASPRITNDWPTAARPGQKRSAMRRLMTTPGADVLSPRAALTSSPASSGTPSALR